MKICRAFTLIELVVVVAVLSILAALLLPALAGAKADTARAICQSNLRQLGTGMRLFEQDHDEMFPPAAFVGLGGQISWDSYIHRYIGGTASDAELSSGGLPDSDTPRMVICPADPDRTINWASYIGAGRRTYAMVGNWQYLQASIYSNNKAYDLSLGTQLGVGVYWSDPTVPVSWDAKSFKTSAVKDPAGTILLVEQSDNMNIAADEWPCVSLGVMDAQHAGMLGQIDPAASLPDQDASQGVNMGKFLYRNHGYRFNYLMHDGHVQALTTNATIGAGTLLAPKGMWTVMAGD
jgi:prepilin-type N-terminal cleavage/methylation domain-containing protein/prepilin-type processing-associated H-X9-DG protein